MRIGQVNRYFVEAAKVGAGGGEGGGGDARAQGEDGCTPDRFRPDQAEVADESHRHVDAFAAGLEPGHWVQAPELGGARWKRRNNTNLAVPRSAEIVPLGTARESFYEKRLLEGLPWHCRSGPETLPAEPGGRRPRKRWRFHCTPPPEAGLSDEQKEALSVSMIDRALQGEPGFEVFCRKIERTFADAGLVCQCCAGAYNAGDVCATCTHAIGFHECEFEAVPGSDEDEGAARATPKAGQRWKAGTLHAGKLDITAAILNLAKRTCRPTSSTSSSTPRSRRGTYSRRS